MTSMSLRLTLAVLLLLAVSLAHAADPVAGKGVFRAQCALCHSAETGDHGASLGPDLSGLYGRHVAGDPAYAYTRELRGASLTWDAATLDRFLAAPAEVVKGTRMTLALERKDDRDALIAYFQALKAGTQIGDAPLPGAPPPTQAAGVTVPRGDGDWRRDQPGRVHRFDAAALPPPRPGTTVVNIPRLVERPPDARANLPPGFAMTVFASQIEGPRTLLVAPNGDIFVAQTRSGRILVLRPSDDDTTAASILGFAQGLYLPVGLALYPSGRHPKWLYVAENNRVVRYAYEVGDRRARSLPEVVVPAVTATSGGHYTRDITFSEDGKHLLLAVGSQTNAAEEMPTKILADIAAWEIVHGPGAVWGDETGRADVLSYPVEDRGPPKTLVTGLTNCVKLTLQPRNGRVWCTGDEREGLGDPGVPDYSTRLVDGQFYGWPWFYMGAHEDPRHKGERPGLAGRVTVPDVLYQAHSGATDLVFYTSTGGDAAFPRDYVGDAFAVLHGSLSGASRTGHKIVRVRMRDDAPTGEYEDFLTGFITDDRSAWGFPIAAAEARDGSLLVSDDRANLIYRISYNNR